MSVRVESTESALTVLGYALEGDFESAKSVLREMSDEELAVLSATMDALYPQVVGARAARIGDEERAKMREGGEKSDGDNLGGSWSDC